MGGTQAIDGPAGRLPFLPLALALVVVAAPLAIGGEPEDIRAKFEPYADRLADVRSAHFSQYGRLRLGPKGHAFFYATHCLAPGGVTLLLDAHGKRVPLPESIENACTDFENREELATVIVQPAIPAEGPVDLDGDGGPDLAFIYKAGSGTGIAIYNLALLFVGADGKVGVTDLHEFSGYSSQWPIPHPDRRIKGEFLTHDWNSTIRFIREKGSVPAARMEVERTDTYDDFFPNQCGKRACVDPLTLAETVVRPSRVTRTVMIRDPSRLRYARRGGTGK